MEKAERKQAGTGRVIPTPAARLLGTGAACSATSSCADVLAGKSPGIWPRPLAGPQSLLS